MPKEVRRIEYSEIELRHALSLYHSRTTGGEATDSRVSGIRVMGGEDFSVVAKVSCPMKDEITRQVFDHATTVAIMVLFSKQIGIPLPKAGHKMLSPTKFGGLAMTVKYHHNVLKGKMPGVTMALTDTATAAPGVVERT
ncbi:hypothetical protein [Terasakiella pusilla]|uniref:hypothetical protein n=1 Tax=Terasakiella pusilla TaxID=64973 RepID=UPI003AA99504